MVTRHERVGVGVIVVRGDKVLFGLRRGAHGGGTWSFPGGHVDDGEGPEASALRELEEETDLRVDNPRATVPAGCQPARGGIPPVSAQSERGRARCRLDAAAEAATDAVVEHIHIATTAGAPIRAVDAVPAIPGVGLDGDRYAYSRGHYQDDRVSRDLTLIEAEAIEVLARQHGIKLAPGETRRNVTTRGIDLNALVGRRFWVGEVLCQGTRLCEPCQYLADLTGKPLLRPFVHRGGLRADILRGGVIVRGDSVRPDEG